MRQFVLTLAGVFAGLVLFLVLVPIALISALSATGSKDAEDRATGAVPHEAVLWLDLREPMLDQGDPQSFSFAMAPSVLDVVEALTRAQSDDRIKGVFIRAPEFGIAPAQAEEIHEALMAMRAHGKFVIAHAQGFEGPSVTSYLAASAADEIWLQSTANFVATGLGAEAAFFGGVFEKIHAEPQFEQFYEYKNAANQYTEKGLTDPHREALTSLIDSLYDASIDRIAAGRARPAFAPADPKAGAKATNGKPALIELELPDALTPGDDDAATDDAADNSEARAHARASDPTLLRRLLESGPHSAEDAYAAGLVDRLGHVDEARDAALERAGSDAAFIEVGPYLKGAGRPYRKGRDVIALVAGQGVIVTGERDPSPFGGGDGFFSDTVADAILSAADDDNVKAIVFRVDSPGGSAIASDQVWHAVSVAQERGKPVVASFGQLAASGGYYVSTGADRIVALPSTITGSIGVLGGKIVFDGTYDLVGFNTEAVSVGGEYTLAYSSGQSFTPEQRAAFHDMLAEVYEDFTGKVADGRALDIERVREIARGRVWSGAQAMERGLVDEYGGLTRAVEIAKELADIKPETDVKLVRYPAAKSPFEALQELFGVSAEGAEALAVVKTLAETPEGRAALDAIRTRDQMARGEAVLLAPVPDVQ